MASCGPKEPVVMALRYCGIRYGKDVCEVLEPQRGIPTALWPVGQRSQEILTQLRQHRARTLQDVVIVFNAC